MQRHLTATTIGTRALAARRPGRWLAVAVAGGVLFVTCALLIVGSAGRPDADDPHGDERPGANDRVPSVGAVGLKARVEPVPAALPSRDELPLGPLAGSLPEPLADSGDAALAPDSDDLPQERAPPRAGSEAALYSSALELAARQDGSLSAAAERAFGGDAPVNERVALLRALWDSGSTDAARWFGVVLAAPVERAATGERLAAGEAVPEFALHFLSHRAAREPSARAILTDFIASAPADADAGRLARARKALAGADDSASLPPSAPDLAPPTGSDESP